MNAAALDPTSRHILRLLAGDGRASYQAIADAVGLSRPAVMERVKRMEEAGLIQGYHARLDRTKAGFPITAFVSIRYPVASGMGDEPIIKALAHDPQVLECHHVAGEDCYVLKVAATSLESLEGVLRRIKEPGTPVSTRTTIVLSSVFEKPGIAPVEDD
jgi:Lrp/AsnC family transcriptional regulator, leucine-responsive regulatory protein